MLRMVPLPMALPWGGSARSVLRLDDGDERLVRAGRRRDSVARPRDEVLQSRPVEAQFLHQAVDDRRLGPVAERRGDGAGGEIAVAARGSAPGRAAGAA